MSWLRDHFHEFVYPAFVAAGKPSDEIGRPFDVRAAACAPDRLPTELKKLWTLCQEHGVQWSYDVREPGASSGASKFRESAKIHAQLLKNTLDSAQAAMRDEGCPRLLLGGRDVWSLAVLSERRGIPYLFVPELSRHVARSPLSRPFLEGRGFRGDELFLDTGFAGSIPKSLRAHFGGEFKFRLMSQSDVAGKFKTFDVVADEDMLVDTTGFPHRKPVKKGEKYQVSERVGGAGQRPNQLFPNRKQARAEALETEYLAKYWGPGQVEGIKRQGHARAVLEDWSKRKNVRRFSDPMGRQLGVTDGVEMIQVSLTDVKIAPGFAEWWQSLAQCPYDDLPKSDVRVYQQLASQESIQRAALLTSQLWRGIPYWKHIPVSPSGPKHVKNSGQGQILWDGAGNLVNQISPGFVVSTTAATSSTVTLTSNSTAGALMYVGDMTTGVMQPYLHQPATPASLHAVQALAVLQQKEAESKGLVPKPPSPSVPQLPAGWSEVNFTV